MKTILNISSYNICHCADYSVPRDEAGKPPVSVDKIAGVLSSLDADIYGLQEVYRIGSEPCFFDQYKIIAKKIGYPNYAYAKGQMFDWGDEIGNAVISRFPIVRKESFAIPMPSESERRPGENEWYEDRVLLETEIRLPSGRNIVFMATHFGLNFLEKERIVKKICERIDNTKCPVILVGDFNARPDGYELAPIYERMVNAAQALGNNEFTFLSFDPKLILDYIFVSPSLVPIEFKVKKVVASDHMPVFAKLELVE